MSPRARRPTDEAATEVRAPGRASAPSVFESFEGDKTREGLGFAALAPSTPTEIDARRPIEQATPTELTARPERSEPLRVISMKDHAERARTDAHRVPLHVQLRSLAEVSRRDTPVGLGRLAPPRDPREARARRLRDNVVWGCVAIVLACVISLGIWFAAGR